MNKFKCVDPNMLAKKKDMPASYHDIGSFFPINRKKIQFQISPLLVDVSPTIFPCGLDQKAGSVKTLPFLPY